MKIDFITPQHDHSADDLRSKREAIDAALDACDESTYQSVISLLEEAGLLQQ